jgi:hypothetical protein
VTTVKSSLLIATLCVVCAGQAQSLKVVPIQHDANNRLPNSIQFFCTQDYDHQACQDDIAKLQRSLLRYPVKQLGQWSFVVASRSESIALQHRSNGSVETPAFTFLSHRTTILERDLFSAAADRRADLFRAYGVTGPALLELAISHELGHAICQEPDERRADDYGRELRGEKTPSCSQAAVPTTTLAVKTVR